MTTHSQQRRIRLHCPAAATVLALAAALPQGSPGAGFDALGDALPPGAVARLGTARLLHTDRVVAVAFSPDGRTVATAAGSNVFLWETATGRPRQWLREPNP